jgi:hypothetical protein
VTGFVVRAPWYVRERDGIDLRDPKSVRPSIQMYDDPQFVSRLLADPRDSLKFRTDDQWSYPVPVANPAGRTGRLLFATSTLVHTNIRKLYQPNHSRFYAVVVEVFCDEPGLPRAGSHEDIDLRLVLRRQHLSTSGAKRPTRRLARNLLVELAKQQHNLDLPAGSDPDVRDVYWADAAWQRRFAEDNAELIDELAPHTDVEAWMVGAAGGQWRAVDTEPEPGRPPDSEQDYPMWRLPPRDEDCAAARTRSLWFGLVPTYSADHSVDALGRSSAKLDEHGIYEVQCFVRQPPPAGHEHCPPKIWWSQPSEPFRLAAAYDPDGTKNRTISVTAPDLRRLAARAGQRQSGGLQISTPPKSGLGPVPFKSIPNARSRTPGGDSICMFAFELFFLVALFLFLLFLPIIVFAFQLWWLLALRFCIPPSASFTVLANFFAAGGVMADIGMPGFEDATAALDEITGLPGDPAAGTPGGALLLKNQADFVAHPDRLDDLVAAADPNLAVAPPDPPPVETKPADPLCR